MRTSWVLYLRS